MKLDPIYRKLITLSLKIDYTNLSTNKALCANCFSLASEYVSCKDVDCSDKAIIPKQFIVKTGEASWIKLQDFEELVHNIAVEKRG